MKMKQILALLLCLLTVLPLFAGCGGEPEETTAPVETTEATEPAPTAPADGNPNDETCKGSYTADADTLRENGEKYVAAVGDQKLTVQQLQVYYWLEVAAFRASGAEGPDFSMGLDVQLTEEGITWQQYFLRRALDSWHAHQALVSWGEDEGAPTEEAYMPNEENHEKYMTDQPATKVLYGYNNPFRPNTVHQAYLDGIGELLETLAQEKGFASADALAADLAGQTVSAETLRWYTELSNRGYMYFTELHYDVKADPEEVESWFADHEQEYAEAGITRDSGKSVNVRHILLVPEDEVIPSWITNPGEPETVSIDENGIVTCPEGRWEECTLRAEELLKKWKSNWERSEYTFADLAYRNSQDPGSNMNGGMYSGVRPGDLTGVLDAWCFDEARQPGDMEILRSEYGIHVMYYSGETPDWYAAAEADCIAAKDADILAEAKEKYPMKVSYDAVLLGQTEQTAGITAAEHLLYHDIAHQRYPEVPLFLQQDYPDTMYGNYKIVTHGCGITTLAMVASYFADDAMFPPLMCEEYADYVYVTGTDTSLFVEAPAEMNFYMKLMTYNCQEAKAYMEQGYITVVLQHKGYWTRGGHYLVLEKDLGDNMIQVRDSNIFNYGRLQRHKDDMFPWSTITGNGMGYFVYEYKRTDIPACYRCGDETTEGLRPGLLTQDYCCEKCHGALTRRNNFLSFCAQ